jgi:hypothetical protein
MQAAALGNGAGKPIRHTRARKEFLPFLNLAMGPRWPLPTGDVAFALDLTLGARFGWTRGPAPTAIGFWLSPLLGYSHASQTHLFMVGAGLGVGARRIAVDYTPRFVIGSGPVGSLLGVRHGLSLHLLNGLFGVEVAHQYTGEHDMRLMFYLNPALLVLVGIGVMVGRPVHNAKELLRDFF